MMKLFKKTWDFCGSRNLSVFIFITGITYSLILYTFALLVPEWWVASIGTMLPFQVFWVLFFTNLVICEIKWIPVVLRRCKKTTAPETEKEVDRYRHKVEIEKSMINFKELAAYLRRRGYRVSFSGDSNGDYPDDESTIINQQSSIFYAQRGRFSPLGNLLFHVAFIFLLVGVYVSFYNRFEGTIHLAEKQVFKGSYGEYTRLDVAPNANFMRTKFKVESIKPQFWGRNLLFTDLVAQIRYEGGEGQAWLSKGLDINGNSLTIEGISYLLMYNFYDIQGRKIDEGYVNMANFAPGSVDSFTIPGYPFIIYVSIYPDGDIIEGRPVTRTMNLTKPVFALKVVSGKIPVYSGVIRSGERAYFGGFSISFPKVQYNGTFQVVKDPGNRWIWAGFIMMIVGLAWRLLFYKREIVLSCLGGTTKLHINAEYAPRLFLERTNSLLRGFYDKT